MTAAAASAHADLTGADSAHTGKTAAAASAHAGLLTVC